MRCLLAEEFVLVGTVPSRLGSVGHTCNHNARVRGQLRMQCWEGGRERGGQADCLVVRRSYKGNKFISPLCSPHP